jgi:excisionase family DNA binding protein
MTLEEPLLTEAQAAARLGVRSQTLAVWRMNGRHDLAFVRLGRTVRYRPTDIDAFIESRMVRTGKGELIAAGV